MTKFVMFLTDHYVKISITLGVLLGLIINLNYTTVYKEDGKYIYECSIGPVYERAEYGNGYIGKYIIDNKEVYTITLK